MELGILLSQATNLKAKPHFTGADERKTHHPMQYIRTTRRTRDQTEIECDVGLPLIINNTHN